MHASTRICHRCPVLLVHFDVVSGQHKLRTMASTGGCEALHAQESCVARPNKRVPQPVQLVAGRLSHASNTCRLHLYWSLMYTVRICDMIAASFVLVSLLRAELGRRIGEAQTPVQKLGPCVLCQNASADCPLVRCLHQGLPSTSTQPDACPNEASWRIGQVPKHPSLRRARVCRHFPMLELHITSTKAI